MSDTDEPGSTPEPAPEPTDGAALETGTPERGTSKTGKTPRWRRVLSIVLLVIGFILVPISGVAIWSKNQLLNTDRYVDTVSPLASNHDIQAAVATAAVNALFNQVNAEQRIQTALPSRASFLGEPLVGAVKGYATKVTDKLLESSQFQKLWDGANRRAHTQLVALLTDDSGKTNGALAIKDGTVKLDISGVITQVQGKLVKAGLTFLSDVHVPPVAATINIIDSEGLSEARSYASLLNTLAWVLPILALAAFVASALIVRTRRRATIRAALVFVGACAFTLVVLAVARSLYLDAVKQTNRNAAEAMFDILLRNLRYGFITLLVLGIIVAIAAYFVGPSAPAVKARELATSGISGARRRADGAGFDAGPVAAFAGKHRHGLEIAVVAVFVLIFLAWNQPGIGTVIGLALICLVCIAFVEFLARESEPEPVPAPEEAELH